VPLRRQPELPAVELPSGLLASCWCECSFSAAPRQLAACCADSSRPCAALEFQSQLPCVAPGLLGRCCSMSIRAVMYQLLPSMVSKGGCSFLTPSGGLRGRTSWVSCVLRCCMYACFRLVCCSTQLTTSSQHSWDVVMGCCGHCIPNPKGSLVFWLCLGCSTLAPLGLWSFRCAVCIHTWYVPFDGRAHMHVMFVCMPNAQSWSGHCHCMQPSWSGVSRRTGSPSVANLLHQSHDASTSRVVGPAPLLT